MILMYIQQIFAKIKNLFKFIFSKYSNDNVDQNLNIKLSSKTSDTETRQVYWPPKKPNNYISTSVKSNNIAPSIDKVKASDDRGQDINLKLSSKTSDIASRQVYWPPKKPHNYMSASVKSNNIAPSIDKIKASDDRGQDMNLSLNLNLKLSSKISDIESHQVYWPPKKSNIYNIKNYGYQMI
jgi:hypothetical protein